MTEPFNYSLPQQNPMQGLTQAFQLATGLRDDQQQQAALQAKQAQTQQMNNDLHAAYLDPTPQTIANLSIKYPQLSEGFKRAHDMKAEDARNSSLAHMSQVHAAVLSGHNDLAVKLLREYGDLQKSGGQDDGYKASNVIADLIEKDPAHANLTMGTALSGLMGPEKYAENFAKFGGESRARDEAPADLATKQAKAQTAAQEAKVKEVEARYADSQAVADLKKKGWDITKIDEDIKIAKEGNRIKAMEAGMKKEDNELKRQDLQLKIDAAKQSRDEKIRENTASAESAANTADNMLNTIERIKKNPSLDSVLGSIQGRAPAVFSDEESNAIELIDTLGSQAFLSQVSQMKGMGALSNAEGEKLQSALQSLSRKQGEKQFRENLDEASRLIKKGREGVSKRTGVPLQKIDTPAAPGARPPLSSFGAP